MVYYVGRLEDAIDKVLGEEAKVDGNYLKARTGLRVHDGFG